MGINEFEKWGEVEFVEYQHYNGKDYGIKLIPNCVLVQERESKKVYLFPTLKAVEEKFDTKLY